MPMYSTIGRTCLAFTQNVRITFKYQKQFWYIRLKDSHIKNFDIKSKHYQCIKVV